MLLWAGVCVCVKGAKPNTPSVSLAVLGNGSSVENQHYDCYFCVLQRWKTERAAVGGFGVEPWRRGLMRKINIRT